MLVDVL
jgi:hypothetical protein